MSGKKRDAPTGSHRPYSYSVRAQDGRDVAVVMVRPDRYVLSISGAEPVMLDWSAYVRLVAAMVDLRERGVRGHW